MADILRNKTIKIGPSPNVEEHLNFFLENQRIQPQNLLLDSQSEKKGKKEQDQDEIYCVFKNNLLFAFCPFLELLNQSDKI